MEWSGLRNLLKEDSGLKTGYKYVANLAQRIAYNLGNTASQTEVKIISCIPIDVTDLHKTIYRLERQLEQAVFEKKTAEKALKSHRAITPAPVSPVTLVPIYSEKSGCICGTVPPSNSCQDPIKDQSKRHHANSCEDPSKHCAKNSCKKNHTKVKHPKRPFYKSFESFYKDSGKGCHGEPEPHRNEEAYDVTHQNSSMTKSRGVSNSNYLKTIGPIQCCHVESDLDYCNNDYQAGVSNKDNSEQLINKPVEKNYSQQHYLQPITEFCRLEPTIAFHRMKSSSILLRDVDLSKDNIKKMSNSLHKQIPEIRTVNTSYDFCSTDANTPSRQVESTGNCKERESEKFTGATNKQEAISVMYQNQPTESVCKESQQTSISESYFKEITPESLGLPNTEPMRDAIDPLSFVRNNQATQEPPIDSCSCCFFKQLKSEDLLLMPRGPLRRYLQNSEQTVTSTESRDFPCKIQKRRRSYRFPKQARGKQDRTTNSFLEDIVSKYHAQSTLQSSSSEYSAPVCRDIDSESCSCCAGVFYDINLLQAQPQHYIKSSSSSNQQYYDDTEYDLIPVKERSKRKEKREVNKFNRQTSPIATNEVIVNFHTVKHHQSNKVTKSKLAGGNIANRHRNMLDSSTKIAAIPNRIKATSSKKKLVFSSKPKHFGCQTELHSDKHEDAFSQIKQTLQVVMDKFKTQPQIEQTKKDAILQVRCCQCELHDRSPFNCLTNPCQTNPMFMPCGAQITTTPFIYPAILASPYCHELPIFMPSKPKRNIHSHKTKLKCKSSFVVNRSSLQKRTSPIPEAEELTGDNCSRDKDSRVYAKDGNAAIHNTEPVQIQMATNGQTNLVKEKEPEIHAIIISKTNITKKHKNKKINCCLSKKQDVGNFRTINNNEVVRNATHYFNDTGSTVRQVIEELENMEQYIIENKIGDVKSSKGSVDTPKKKFVDLFRNIKKVFKSHSKHNKKIDKRMSLDNLGIQQAKGFRLPSVHLIYPPRQKFPFSRKQEHSGYSPLMTERYSYTDLHSKKCRDRVSSIRKRRSKGFKL